MGRGNWWMLASPVQVPRKGKGDMGGYRSILEQADWKQGGIVIDR